MRGQTKNAAQDRTVAKLKAKGWRESDMFNKHVPMYFDRPFTGLPRPHVVWVDRDGRVCHSYRNRMGCGC